MLPHSCQRHVFSACTNNNGNSHWPPFTLYLYRISPVACTSCEDDAFRLFLLEPLLLLLLLAQMTDRTSVPNIWINGEAVATRHTTPAVSLLSQYACQQQAAPISWRRAWNSPVRPPHCCRHERKQCVEQSRPAIHQHCCANVSTVLSCD